MKENGVTVESAQQIAVDFIKKTKSSERVEVSTVEQDRDIWMIRGICPIDLEGHPWAERFEIAVDTKGRIRSSTFALL